MHRTLDLMEKALCWPNMEEDVESYVNICLLCQQDKVERVLLAGLLELLHVSERL